jgi:hypothetical protein
MRRKSVGKRRINENVRSGAVDESVKRSTRKCRKRNRNQKGSLRRGKDQRFGKGARSGSGNGRNRRNRGNRGAEECSMLWKPTQERTLLPWVDEEFFAWSSGMNE